MSPELIAILVTALVQLVGIVILARMERENGRMLEHIDGVDAAIFPQGLQMKEVFEEEVRALLQGHRVKDVAEEALRFLANYQPNRKGTAAGESASFSRRECLV